MIKRLENKRNFAKTKRITRIAHKNIEKWIRKNLSPYWAFEKRPDAKSSGTKKYDSSTEGIHLNEGQRERYIHAVFEFELLRIWPFAGTQDDWHVKWVDLHIDSVGWRIARQARCLPK